MKKVLFFVAVLFSVGLSVVVSSNTKTAQATFCQPPKVWACVRFSRIFPQLCVDYGCVNPSPTPTPSPLPTATPSPSPEPTDIPEATPTPEPTSSPVPSTSPTPEPTPVPQQQVTTEVRVDTVAKGSPDYGCGDIKPGDVGNIFVAVGIPNDQKLEVRWVEPSGADKVHIRYAEYNDAGWTHALLHTPNDGNEIIGSLKNGVNYRFQVAGVAGCAVGNWSATFDPKP